MRVLPVFDVSARLTSVAFLAFLCSCSTPRPGGVGSSVMTPNVDDLRVDPGVSRSSDLVDASVISIWAILPTVFNELEIELSVHDPQEKLLGSMQFHPRRLGGNRLSQYLDCGRSVGVASNADSYRVTMSLVTRVKEGDGGRALIETEIIAVAEPRGVRGDAVNCTSKGALERQIVEMVQERTRP